MDPLSFEHVTAMDSGASLDVILPKGEAVNGCSVLGLGSSEIPV